MSNQQHASRLRALLTDLRGGKAFDTSGDVQAAIEAGAQALEGKPVASGGYVEPRVTQLTTSAPISDPSPEGVEQKPLPLGAEGAVLSPKAAPSVRPPATSVEADRARK